VRQVGHWSSPPSASNFAAPLSYSLSVTAPLRRRARRPRPRRRRSSLHLDHALDPAAAMRLVDVALRLGVGGEDLPARVALPALLPPGHAPRGKTEERSPPPPHRQPVAGSPPPATCALGGVGGRRGVERNLAAAGKRRPKTGAQAKDQPRGVPSDLDPEKKLRLGTFGPAPLWVMASTLSACPSSFGSSSNRTAGGFGAAATTSNGSGTSTRRSNTPRIAPLASDPARCSSTISTDG